MAQFYRRKTDSFAGNVAAVAGDADAASPLAGDIKLKALGPAALDGPTPDADVLIGTSDADTIDGLAGNDVIEGRDGNDALTGGAGADTLRGEGGNDLMNAADGEGDTLEGGANDDTYVVDGLDIVTEAAGQGNDTIYATQNYALATGAEIEILSASDAAAVTALNLTGNEYGQTIIGNAGANFLVAGGGADGLYGGLGDDTYSVDTLDAVIDAGGNDIIYSSTNYQLNAGAEIETLSANDFSLTTALNLAGNEFGQSIFGNAGNNFLIAGGGADGLYGGLGDDTYSVDTLDVVIDTGGFDTIYSSTNFQLNAGAQIEILSANDFALTTPLNLAGNEYDQQIFGNAGDNFLIAGGGADGLYGKGGNDTYSIDSQDVVVENAGEGYDTIYTSTSFILGAGTEIEVISVNDYAATSAINLTGNATAQQLFGNAGANSLDGGAGSDQLSGGGGADTFDFTTALGAANIDVILDFSVVDDTIRLAGGAGQPFAALASGTLAAGAFVIGTGALDANDYLIYNSATGALSYDADGNGAGAAVQFATLATGLSLTAADFVVAGAANAAPAIGSGATASIAENSAASTIVYQTAATDADGDRITYTLTGTDAALLNIDANGAVRLNAPADYEAKSSYSFNVVASDSNVSTAKAVTLTITNVSEASTPNFIEFPNPNNGIAHAQSIEKFFLQVAPNPNLADPSLPSGSITGGLSTPTDKDFYSITLGAGELLILDVDGTEVGLDTVLRLYTAGGTLIGENDDYGRLDTGSIGVPEDPSYSTDSYIRWRAPTAGTYYFSLESYEHDTDGSYKIYISVGPPGTAAQILAEDVDSLISGSQWDHTNLTYGFPTSASQYPGTEFVEVNPATKFTAFTATQITATTQLLAIIANVSGLTFARDTAHPGDADLRFAMSTDADPAYAYYPTNGGPTSVGGTAWFDRTDFSQPFRGSYDWMGILHETGHALGLKHGHEMPAISPDHDSLEYSVMTYRAYPGGDVEGGYTNETWGFPQTLMMLDIAALQKMYGANYAYNATNSVYTWSSSNGEMSINGVGQGRPGEGSFGGPPSSANRVFLTIWDGGGTDTYDMSNYGAAGVRIDLRPGEWSKTSTVQLANLGSGLGEPPHFARGNVANALLFDGDTRSLIENAIGSSGGDRIIANQAANVLTGNAGADTFQWTSGTHAGIGTLADRIADFLSGTDKIDLGDVDSFTGTSSTNESFTFIGTAAFTAANQLRYEVINGDTHIYADLNNNHIADFEIVLTGVTTPLVATDFIL